MSSTFTPNTSLDADTNPKDVGYLLGLLAENDSICFTRASLINFLKVQGVEIDTHYSQLRRLPKYATFGRITDGAPQPAAPAAAPAATPSAAAPAPARANDEYAYNPAVRDASGDAFKPTRRVREAIGGGSEQIAGLFGSGNDDEPLRETAPSRTNVAPPAPAAVPSAAAPPAAAASSSRSVSSSSAKYSEFEPSTGVYDADGNAFKPTRRVREPIGGGSEQIAGLFGGGENDDEYENRPSSGRRSDALTRSPPPPASRPRRRGAFIVIEGLDRAGKSTQVDLLAEYLRARRRRASHARDTSPSTSSSPSPSSSSSSSDSDPVRIMKFPDRTTRIGTLINEYLTSPASAKEKAPLPARAIHLLFAANRWELASTLVRHLQEGRDVVADRYAFSGVAYALATTESERSEDSGEGEGGAQRRKDLGEGKAPSAPPTDGAPARLAQYLAPDAGLPAPDVTLFLSLRPETAALRGGYGEERFEKEEVQRRVRGAFRQVEGVVTRGRGPETALHPQWRTIPADVPPALVFEEVKRAVEGVVRRLEEGAAVVAGKAGSSGAQEGAGEEGAGEASVSEEPRLGRLW